jgi:hypothetical protein
MENIYGRFDPILLRFYTKNQTASLPIRGGLHPPDLDRKMTVLEPLVHRL